MVLALIVAVIQFRKLSKLIFASAMKNTEKEKDVAATVSDIKHEHLDLR